MVAEVIRLKRKNVRAHNPDSLVNLLIYRLLNGLFVLDAAWHIWALASNHDGFTLISKFLLCFILALTLIQQLGNQIPVKIISAVLFCLAGDILLQPLDMDYTNMSGDRPIHFILGVICFCAAYVQLIRYYMTLNPQWLRKVRAKPVALVVNAVVTLLVLIWLTVQNQAQASLLVVLWLYSPVVIGAATLATYTRSSLRPIPFLALVIGSNAIAFSDTIIGLTVYPRMPMPLLSNPVWILSTYIVGIFLVFNAVIAIEKRAPLAIR